MKIHTRSEKCWGMSLQSRWNQFPLRIVRMLFECRSNDVRIHTHGIRMSFAYSSNTVRMMFEFIHIVYECRSNDHQTMFEGRSKTIQMTFE